MQHLDSIGRITDIKIKSDINPKKSSKTEETQIILFVTVHQEGTDFLQERQKDWEWKRLSLTGIEAEIEQSLSCRRVIAIQPA